MTCTCTSKINIFVSSFKSLIKNKRKDQFDQMVVMVNYYHRRGHLQELFKQALTISAGCSNYKSGDNGNFDYTRELHQPLRGKELLHFREKTLRFSDLYSQSVSIFITCTVSSQPPERNSLSWPGVYCTLNTRLIWPSITRCEELSMTHSTN